VPIPESGEASELVELLGTDLLALIRARGVPLAKLSAITGLPSPVRKRAAFAVEFADGTKLKARRLKSAQRADAVVRLRDAIGAGFAPILARRGDAMLLEWVEGRTLASLESIPGELLRRCGRMLGALHRLPCESLPDGTSESPGELLAKLERDMDLVRSAQLVDPDLSRRALAGADANRPEEPTLGIVHKDFCAENIVLASDGSLVCVDEATLSTGPHDLDLARTWYRWPMQARDSAHFAGGYQEHRSLGGFLRHFRFWATCVLVGSAATRLRSASPGAQAPVERLRQLHDGRLEAMT
jgi:aminoglycoside phosphotransferase (APT) family kinase protein